MAEDTRRVTKLQDFADTLTTIGGGWRTTFVYLNMVALKKTGQSVDMDKFSSAIDNDSDLDQDVSANFRNFVNGGATRKNRFPYCGIIKAAKYTVNWQTAKKHREHYDDFVTKSDELSARYAAQILKRQGLPLTQDALDSVQIKPRSQRDFERQENGQEVKPRKDARRLVDYGKGGMYIRTNDFDKNGNNRVVIPQNMKTVTRGGSHYYLINDDGSIAGGKPVSFKTIEHVLGGSKGNIESGTKAAALRKLGADENEIAAYLKEFEELNWSENDFMADMFLYAIASCTDGYHEGMPSKVIFFNKELVDEIVKGKDSVKINPSQFLDIAKSEINSTYGITVESKRYMNRMFKQIIKESNLRMKNKKLIRLTESDLHRMIENSVKKYINEIGRFESDLDADEIYGDRADREYRQSMRDKQFQDDWEMRNRRLRQKYPGKSKEWYESMIDTFYENKKSRKAIKESFQNNQNYSHFAVNKATNKIVNGWDYSDYDPSELRQFKNDYFTVDLVDNDLDPKQYKIVTSKYLIRQGIDPNDNNNWANS